jgi:hypothetical protein
MATSTSPQTGTPVRLALRPAERLMLALIIALGVAAVALTIVLDRQVNWPPFLVGFAATLAMIAVGAYARAAKSAPRLALCTIGIGLFMGFTACSSVFIFALFPLPNPLIDPTLMAADRLIGYSWKGFAEGLAAIPSLPWALSLLYMSSLLQVGLVIILLGSLGREVALHRFLLVGMLTLLVAVCIWYLWPSVGPNTVEPVTPALRDSIGTIASPWLAETLLSLIKVGPPVITPEIIIGVVSFPSYHIIMALMVWWYSRGTPAFIPASIIGVGMIPATLLHGGHHVVDLVAGTVLFVACAQVTARLIGNDAGQRQP